MGAFAYSTAGLSTVGIQGTGQEAFVPWLAVSGSLALALASVGVLIYFIHHLAHSIQIDTIMSQVERETRSVIDDVYPHQPRYRGAEERCPEPPLEAVGLPAARSGYVQAVDPEPLVALAVRDDLVIVLAMQVGDHVVAGTPIAWAWRWSPGRPPGAGALAGAVAARPARVRRTQGAMSASASPAGRQLANRRCQPPNDPPGVQAVQHLRCCCGLARLRLGDWTARPGEPQGLPVPKFSALLRLGSQIRCHGAQPAVTRALIVLLRDVGTSSATEDRRHACVRNIRLVLDDARRATPSPPTPRRSPPRPPPPCACSGSIRGPGRPPRPGRPGRRRGRPSRCGGRRSRPSTAR